MEIRKLALLVVATITAILIYHAWLRLAPPKPWSEAELGMIRSLSLEALPPLSKDPSNAVADAMMEIWPAELRTAFRWALRSEFPSAIRPVSLAVNTVHGCTGTAAGTASGRRRFRRSKIPTSTVLTGYAS